jgi:hypothetical protein
LSIARCTTDLSFAMADGRMPISFACFTHSVSDEEWRVPDLDAPQSKTFSDRCREAVYFPSCGMQANTDRKLAARCRNLECSTPHQRTPGATDKEIRRAEGFGTPRGRRLIQAGLVSGPEHSLSGRNHARGWGPHLFRVVDVGERSAGINVTVASGPGPEPARSTGDQGVSNTLLRCNRDGECVNIAWILDILSQDPRHVQGILCPSPYVAP